MASSLLLAQRAQVASLDKYGIVLLFLQNHAHHFVQENLNRHTISGGLTGHIQRLPLAE